MSGCRTLPIFRYCRIHLLLFVRRRPGCWNVRWRDSGRNWPKVPDHRRTWDEALGDEFADAIVSSTAWHLDQKSVRQVKALCLTAGCDTVTENAEREVAKRDIY